MRRTRLPINNFIDRNITILPPSGHCDIDSEDPASSIPYLAAYMCVLQSTA